jgi:tyrosine-protein kinase Etk/Wzc
MDGHLLELENSGKMQLKDDKTFSDAQHGNLLEGGLSDYFRIILKYRKFISRVVGVAFVLSILISFLLPKMYMATARVLPPEEDNSGLFSLLSNIDNPLSGMARSIIGNQTPTAVYVGIMKSRTVADELNRKFHLKELYGAKYIEDVYSELEDRTTIEINRKDQLISVSVRDRDPRRASEMANAYVDMLDQINRRLNITQGKRKRLFLEDRLKEVRSDLEKAEVNLKAFQEKYHLVSIEQQAKVVIEGAAEIQSEIIASQTELEVLKQFGTEKQIEAVMLKAKIEELQNQLNSIEQGEKMETDVSNTSTTTRGSKFYIPFDKLPQLGMELMRLMREAKIQEKLFELITAQYEMAQIEEAKDVGTVQVIDHAVPPEKKISPKRGRIVIAATILVFFIAALLVIGLEYRRDLKDLS